MSKTIGKYPIYLNAFEIGVLIGVISRLNEDEKKVLGNVFKQLLKYRDKFYRDAGVKITELGGGWIKLEDRYGNVIIRKRYEWE